MNLTNFQNTKQKLVDEMATVYRGKWATALSDPSLPAMLKSDDLAEKYIATLTVAALEQQSRCAHVYRQVCGALASQSEIQLLSRWLIDLVRLFYPYQNCDEFN